MYNDIDPRAEKRLLGYTTSQGAMYEAWTLGGWHGETGVHRNPYPAGRRHNEYERGHRTSDPMGDHHGRNV